MPLEQDDITNCDKEPQNDVICFDLGGIQIVPDPKSFEVKKAPFDDQRFQIPANHDIQKIRMILPVRKIL